MDFARCSARTIQLWRSEGYCIKWKPLLHLLKLNYEERSSRWGLIWLHFAVLQHPKPLCEAVLQNSKPVMIRANLQNRTSYRSAQLSNKFVFCESCSIRSSVTFWLVLGSVHDWCLDVTCLCYCYFEDHLGVLSFYLTFKVVGAVMSWKCCYLSFFEFRMQYSVLSRWFSSTEL